MRWQSSRKLPDQQFVPPLLHMFTTGWIHGIPMCKRTIFQYSDGCMSKYSAHRLSRSTLYWPSRWIISSEQQYMQAILPMSGRTIHILHLSRRHIFSYGYKLLYPGSPTQLSRPKMCRQSSRKLPDQQFVPSVLHVFTTGWIHRIPMRKLAVFQYSDGCMPKYSAHRLPRSTVQQPNRRVLSSEQQSVQTILPMPGRTIHILHLSRKYVFPYRYKLLHPGSPTQLSRPKVCRQVIRHLSG
jgi:hypothetical protein